MAATTRLGNHTGCVVSRLGTVFAARGRPFCPRKRSVALKRFTRPGIRRDPAWPPENFHQKSGVYIVAATHKKVLDTIYGCAKMTSIAASHKTFLREPVIDPKVFPFSQPKPTRSVPKRKET
ncbi:hypothetical protein [Paraburkholderia mimosarum]|uniref:hypothetical protein n=1 Tax=Paraburkholderia mimosarum TaxID=312026 RepID=UPI00138DF976|nr:hypothetical protein [Paraburkholderia mimosarum]